MDIVLKPVGDIAIVEFDMVGEKVNKFNSTMLYRLREIIAELKKSSYKCVIFKSNKPKIFIAGADIDEIKSLKTREQFAKGVETGQALFCELEDLPMPTIAAIHGACAGGGCEFTLACDYRICTDDKSTRIGLPETKLGIIPGFGGCVRLPRMVGLQAGFDIILGGKMVDSKKALKIGLVDKVVYAPILMDQAILWAKEIIKNGSKKCCKTYEPKGVMNILLESIGKSMVYSQAAKGVLKATHGHYPALMKAIEVVKETYGMSDRTRAMQIERDGFLDMVMTDVSRNLLHVYDLTEMVKKQTGVSGKEVKAHPVKHLGVLGAGTMGGGIAYVAADKGVDARVKDINYEAVGKALKHARELWAKDMKRKRITSYELNQKMGLVSGTLDYSGFKAMDVVVEAIVEDMEIKKKVIAETARNMRPDAIIVTNTSSLSVNEMQSAHPHPEVFAGMHFFNPVHKMPLVEVIRGAKTSDETVATVFELSKKMGKMPVVVKDSPGFLVNRLLLPYMGEAAFLLQEGMSIETVDSIFVNEFGMPMGPFALMDEVGLDVCVKVVKIFQKAFGSRVEMASCMTKLDKAGRLGKKNGKGFYQYDSRGFRGEVDNSFYAELDLSTPTNSLTSKECIERCVFAMVNECSLALFEDRIVETPQEVDLAMIMGTGFPPFRGGLLKYADSVGTQYICDQLEVYSAKGAARLKPTTPLKQMAKDKKKFY